MTLADQVQMYLDHLEVERGSAANTLQSYARDLRRYQEYLAERGIESLAEVTESDIREFLVALRRGDPDKDRPPLADSSIARTLVTTRGFHKFAAGEGLVQANVAHAVAPPKAPRRLPKSLPVDEVLAILAASGGDDVSDGPRSLRDRALLELLYSCGARISEAVTLDVDDIDTGSRSVLLRGKGGKERVVPVGRPAECMAGARRRGSARGIGQIGLPAHAAAQFRDPSVGRRCRCARGAGTPGSRVGDHHPGLHAGHGRHHA
jgi:integrase/recombinase XerD